MGATIGYAVSGRTAAFGGALRLGRYQGVRLLTFELYVVVLTNVWFPKKLKRTQQSNA